jgi:micrococcal nuclease
MIYFAIILALLGVPAFAATVEGRVIAIGDGDTLTLLVDHKPIKVRLAEIDAPESKQSFGSRSRQSLAAVCFQKPATVTTVSHDRYGRLVGYVTCAETDAQAHQVSTGMAWVFDRYSKPDSPLYALQSTAKAARIGLWSDQTPIPPWEWRKKP